MRLFTLLIFFLSLTSTFAQKGNFTFGSIALPDLSMKTYDQDTSAAAVILREFGHASIDQEYNVVFEYHVMIKILKERGKHFGDFTIGLEKTRKVIDYEERLISLQAVTYNLGPSGIDQTKFNEKTIINEAQSKFRNNIKIPMPNVKVGSVIEIHYITKSPYLFLFQPWAFQADIPTRYSEYWAQIPANFTYNIVLRGYQELAVNKIERVPKCFQRPGSEQTGFGSDMVDCSLSKYVMENVPAFKYEEYLTSAKNYRSAVHFELSEYIDLYGKKKKFAEKWRDIAHNLEQHESFGLKLKRSRKFMESIVPSLVGMEKDPLKKAQIIYDHIKNRYLWNGEENKYTDFEIKKTYEERKGSSADINMALIGALKAAELTVYPVLASTRSNGIPGKVNAQRADFDYVLAQVTINDQHFLLDATDPLLPFGMLPFQCLNDQGRLLSDDGGNWIDLKTAVRRKTLVRMDFTFTESGTLTGKLDLQYFGYEALQMRKWIGKNSEKERIREHEKDWKHVSIAKYEVSNAKEIDQPLIESMEVTFEQIAGDGQTGIFLSPFLFNRFLQNPFNAATREYPVDLGTGIEMTHFLSLTLPENLKLDDLPPNAVFTLPNGDGKALLNSTINGNKLTVTSMVVLAKKVYETNEYTALRDFMTKVVDIQNKVIVLKKNQL